MVKSEGASLPDQSTKDSDEFDQRLQKLGELKEQFGEAYPNDFRVSCSAAHFFSRYDAKVKEGEGAEESLAEESLAGRIVGKRFMGKAAFLHIQDYSGKIQIYVKKDKVGAEAFQTFKKVDLGDFVGVTGHAFRTKTKELTVACSGVRILCKALRPLPEKWHGLQDVEMRYRQRYLDLISNEKARQIFQTRSLVIQKIRQFLNEREFFEVETPMMQSLPGGAVARPFVTHHNALNMELYLRVAPELFLKRLVVGGFERVFEINKNFRNEGISTQHNPEFTMLEFYQAYATYEDLMDLTEELITGLVREVTGGKTEINYQGQILNFSRPWKRLTLCEAIQDYCKNHQSSKVQACATKDIHDVKTLKEIGKQTEVELEGDEKGKLQAVLFEALVEETLIQPTFITQYPVAVSPLSRRNAKDPEYVDRFELMIYGREIANAFSELNDPLDQRGRFENQLKLRDLGDDGAWHASHSG